MDSKVLAELDFIFSQLPPSYKNRVPKNMIVEARTNKSMERYNELDFSKPFTAQPISKDALEIFNKIIAKYLSA